MRRNALLLSMGLVLSACNPWSGLYAPIPPYQTDDEQRDAGADTRELELDVEAGVDVSIALGAPSLRLEETVDAVVLSWSEVPGATGYEVQSGDGEWVEVGDALMFTDDAAEGGTLSGSPVLVASDGTSDEVVSLSIDGDIEAVRGASRSYAVRATRADEEGPRSSPITGGRLVGVIDVEFSADDGTGGYVVLSDDGVQATHDGAPINGDHVGYKAQLRADGVEEVITLEDTGRLLAVVDVAAGDQVSCAVLSNGKVKCWGVNRFGLLGHGTTTASVGGAPGEMPPPDSVGLDDAVKVSLGLGNAVVFEEGGGVRIWGNNQFGQVYGSSEPVVGDQQGEVPVTMPFAYSSDALDGAVKDVQMGFGHACALDWAGRVFCWGANNMGQLGRGDMRWTPLSRQKEG